MAVAVLLFAAVGLIGYRLWMRLHETESAIERLTQRIAAVELARGSIPSPVVPAPQSPGARAVSVPAVAALPPPSPPAPPRAAVAAPVTTVSEQPPSIASEPLESRIGSRWLLYVGVVAIVVGVSYFEKLAIDNHWVNETWRVIQGGIAGLAFVAAGLGIVRRGYRLYGQILAGTGVAILYVSTYAAFNFYQLISHPVAFVLMSAITILAAWLANAQRSQGLAIVAVTGGFATPFLLPTGTDSEIALFGYDTILIAGTIWLARRRDWPVLNGISYAFTALTVLSWAAVFYRPSTYLTTELFLTVFCGLFLYGLRGTYQSTRASAPFVGVILWTAPLGFYVLSLVNLFDHSVALLIYLVILALVGVLTGTRTNAWIRLLFWFAVAAPLTVWTAAHAGETAWIAGGQAAWIGVYLLYLAALFAAMSGELATFGEADIALLHLNALATYFGLYLLPGPGHTDRGALMAAAFAVLNGGFAYLVRNRSRDEAVHFIALAGTFAMIVIALAFQGPWITIGWATEGVLVTWLGLHERRLWLRAAGLAVFAAAVLRLLGAQMAPPAAGALVLLNSRGLSGLFVIALTYLLAYLHQRYGRDSAHESTSVAIFAIVASMLTLSLLTSEINAYWHVYDTRHTSASASTTMRFAREMMTSITWAVYATILVIVGLLRKYAPVRYFAMTVFAVTIVKVFAIDLSELDRIYRVLSIIGLGLTLLLTSYLYQKLNADPKHP
jgi:uncharacterized membrane protein